jgi:uncharacterized membrane protein YdjX (TVP38/TMEM64 family)
LYSTLGRMPGIFISAYFGSQMFMGNIHLLLIIAVIMSILFVIGMLREIEILEE